MRIRNLAMAFLVVVVIASVSSCSFFLGFFNRFWVDDVEYEIDSMVIEAGAQNTDGSFEMDVLLYSNGITYSDDATWTYPFDGNGHVIRLTVHAPASSLVEGDYRWSAEHQEYTFTSGVVIINGDYNDGTRVGQDYLYVASAGTVWVSEPVLGDYVVDFDITGSDSSAGEAAISGHYRGAAAVETP